MRHFFSSRLRISKTFVVVFTLQPCISWNFGIRKYSSERKLHSAFLGKIQAQIYRQHQNTQIYNMLFKNKKKYRKMRDFFSSILSIFKTFVVVFTLVPCFSLICGIHTNSSERKMYSAFSVEDTRLDIHVTPKHIELQRIVQEKQDKFTQCGISSHPD